MKAFCWILLFALFSTVAYSQSNLVIEGVITDIATKQPIAHATVTLRASDTTVEIQADEKGKYKFTSPLLKVNKIYVLYAHSDNPAYGYSGNSECFASTNGLGSNPRTYVRNIELRQNVTYGQAPAPAAPVHFSFKENTLPHPDKDSVLNVWLHYLKYNPSSIVEIEGYVDKKEGNKSFRLMLSRARSQECINYLHDSGIQLNRLRLMGNSENNPVMSRKAIRKTKGKDAKMAARLLNCRCELSLKNIFFPPPSTIIMKGMVTDINTKEPVNGAFVAFSGSDGTRVTTATNVKGIYNVAINNYNPLTFYNVIAEANGYNSSDPEDVFTITPESKDLPVYSHNFRIEKNGYEKPFVFPPILFDSGSVTLSAVAIDSLNSVKKIMDQRPGLVVEFMGDADWHEIDYVNLSLTRAQVCVNYLVSKGIDQARFTMASHVSEAGQADEEKYMNNIVKHKERQRLFDHKECNVTFWITRWDYGQTPF